MTTKRRTKGDDSWRPLETTASRRRIFVQPDVLMAVLWSSQGLQDNKVMD